MNAKEVRRHLAEGKLLFDGATGTYAATMAGWPKDPVELACMEAPQRVLALHQAYIQAGCDAIKTNTFAAHVGLAVCDDVQQRQVVQAAVEIARNAAGKQAAVFADIGPSTAGGDAAKAYITLADIFLSLGVDCFLFETLSSADGIEQAAFHIRKKNRDAFIAVSFAAGPDGFTREGESAAKLIEQMDGLETVDAAGLNCFCGSYHMRRLISTLPKIGKHVIAMPNAGYPHVINGRTYYDSDPAYYAQQAAGCVDAGASIVGGCCGTTPEHIRQIRFHLEHMPRESQNGRAVLQTNMQTACASRVKQKLEIGGRPILVELDPPKDSGIASFISGARKISAAGADAITIADCPIGRASMDSSLLACKLSRELGIEAIPHMTCRDRNVNATKALLLGLSMEGVHNVLAVTGDPVPSADRDSVKSVFQFNSRVLARFVRSLEQSRETDPFFLCGALNVNAVNFDIELARAKEKEACGIEAFLTQPVLTEQAAKNMEKARNGLKGKIFGGLFPVVSCKNAQFLDSEVSGIAVDKRIIDAYQGLDRAAGEKMAVRLCRDAAKRIVPYVDGFYIMTPFQRVDLVCRIISEIEKI